MAKASEHGHEMAEISAYAEGSDGDRVVKALAALVGGTAGDLAEVRDAAPLHRRDVNDGDDDDGLALVVPDVLCALRKQWWWR